MLQSIEQIKKLIIPTLIDHEVARAAIFGSYATGLQNESSDLDLLVEFRGEKSLFDLVALQQCLEEKLGFSTDVLTFEAVHPRLKETIANEQVVIL